MEKVIKGIKIDPKIFTRPFIRGCDIAICSGECCRWGVYVDKYEMEAILENKDLVKKYMDETQTQDETKWFEPLEEDSDFASGYCAGTELYNDKCVFLDKRGYCTLQKMAMAENEYKWKYKPIYCVLFPLMVFEGVLCIDEEHLERQSYCSKAINQTSTVFEACKEEIIHLLGQDGYEELCQYKAEYEKSLNACMVQTL